MRALLVGLLIACVAAGCATVAPRDSAMTVPEKIGQLFVVVGRGAFLNEESAEYRELVHQVRDHHAGAILWASGSEVYETALLTRRLQEVARLPLLVSADLEAGPGMRFVDTTYWPWAMAVGATGDTNLARREGEAVAEEARAIGLNQIDAPVADLNTDPDNPVINVRSFGEDPETVAQFVSAFVSGVQSRHVLATVKHFPGHGDTAIDSHRSLPSLSATRERLEAVELVPFRAAIAAGVGAVMTAHLAVPSVDPSPAPLRPNGPSENPYTRDASEVSRNATVPASLSAKITGGLLRGELGFRGLVVTDALDMGGIVDHFDAGEAAVRAILAGADQILKSSDTDSAMTAVRAAVDSGRISEARLDQSVKRILAAKREVGVALPDPERIFRVVDSSSHRALADEIASRSLTLVREAPGALPIEPGQRVLLVTVGDSPARPDDDLVRELTARLQTPPDRVALDARSTDAEVRAALEAAQRADRVILALFVRFQSGRGTITIPPAAKEAAQRLAAAGVKTVTVSFGSPYILRELPAAPTYLAAYGGQPCMQIAAVRALLGQTAITGRLPVTIPDLAPRGTGIQKPPRSP